MNKKVLLGNEAIVRAVLSSGVSFISGYPGCPSAEIGDELGVIAKGPKGYPGIYTELSTNEKVALESAIGASFSGLRSLVHMKSFGINVCSDSLLPLAYTGTKAGMVIVVADDPSCWSSAQTEQNSRAYASFAHIPFLEPSDPQECHDFTKLGFEISEEFNTPVILRTTTRVAHQKSPVVFEDLKPAEVKGNFIKNSSQFSTMFPKVMKMKGELLEKIKKIKKFAEKSEINVISGKKNKIGIITSGVSYLHVKESLEILGLDLPVFKLGFFYPLPDEKIKNFLKGLKKVLIVEELDSYLEKEVALIARNNNTKLQIFGKNLLPEIGELNPELVCLALAKITGKKYSAPKIKKNNLPERTAKLCDGCPYWHVFPALKNIVPPDTIFGGDIGCNMIAGLPPHNMHDYLFSMGASMGISHGVKKTTGQKVVSLIGDGTFFHAGIPGLINIVYNKSNPLIIVLDNRITAMTGHQPNPGMGKNLMGEPAEEIKIEDIAKACGVKHIKVLDPINAKEFEDTVKDFLAKDEVSMIICKRICALLDRRQKNA